MIRVGSIVLRTQNIGALRDFWSQALDYVARDAEPDADFMVLRPRDGIGPNISLDEHHSQRSLPPRIHFDLYADDQSAEVERLTALGATAVEWDKLPADADYVIMQDPEGNRFCVVQA